MQKILRLIARLIVARHECTYMYVRHCKENGPILLRSTGNAYDVISHRRLSGPRAPLPNILDKSTPKRIGLLKDAHQQVFLLILSIAA